MPNWTYGIEGLFCSKIVSLYAYIIRTIQNVILFQKLSIILQKPANDGIKINCIRLVSVLHKELQDKVLYMEYTRT